MQGSVLHAASEKKVVDPTKQFGLGYCHAPSSTCLPPHLPLPLVSPALAVWLSQGPHPPSRKITSSYTVDMHFNCFRLGRQPPSFENSDGWGKGGLKLSSRAWTKRRGVRTKMAGRHPLLQGALGP